MNFNRFRSALGWMAFDLWAAYAAAVIVGFSLGSAVGPLLLVTLLAAGGIYSTTPRYLGFHEAIRFVVAVAAVATVLVVVGESLGATSAFVNLYVLAAGGARAFRRRAEVMPRRSASEGGAEPIRTLVVGAGDAAEWILRELDRTPRPSHRVLALLDDDETKWGTSVRGICVVGGTLDVARFAESLGAQEVLIAIPSAEGNRMREIVSACRASGVKVRTLPAVSDLLSGVSALPQTRDVAIEDLLRRSAVPVDATLGANAVKGKTVLITGGGGSIGTEVARQIARLGPARLVLLGRGENSLFEARQKLMLEGFGEAEVVVADVRDRQAIAEAFKRFKPNVVFHAAAHKHVPLMEAQPIEAFRNNVLGTRNVLRAAVEVGTERFTLVSTDKAVRPGNVMGATKRLAELLTIDTARRHRLAYAAVRFGNVLNSRGSLVPSLVAQMAHGGPVRITDERMTRYFMTIPEAAQLIVHAGASAEPGAIYILDMGEPIRIVDLAYDLMRLHGHIPEVTMPVVVTGARPGEKLHEELVYDAEELWPTAHPSIRAAMPSADEAWGIGAIVERLSAMADAGDAEGVRAMLLCPPQVVASAPVSEPLRFAA